MLICWLGTVCVDVCVHEWCVSQCFTVFAANMHFICYIHHTGYQFLFIFIFIFMLTGLIEFSSPPVPPVPSPPSPVQLEPSSAPERTALLGSICNFNKATLRRTVAAASSDSLNQGRVLPWMTYMMWRVHICMFKKAFKEVLVESFVLSVKCIFKHFWIQVK